LIGTLGDLPNGVATVHTAEPKEIRRGDYVVECPHGTRYWITIDRSATETSP
jgi:hypothetical protein